MGKLFALPSPAFEAGIIRSHSFVSLFSLTRGSFSLMSVCRFRGWAARGVQSGATPGRALWSDTADPRDMPEDDGVEGRSSPPHTPG